MPPVVGAVRILGRDGIAVGQNGKRARAVKLVVFIYVSVRYILYDGFNARQVGLQ